ncbi:tat pathway signal sequence [Actinokineospora sp. G85]|uniref:tat pathway signal sequence n=1 Tax=Actinokineospora sp. G85 TaxID=3406626 RepID=UPI003C715B93
MIGDRTRLALVALLLALTGCSAPSPAASPHPAASSENPVPCSATGFDCDLQRRIAAAEDYIATRPGTVGVVLRDRETGAVWRNDHAEDLTWTASTIKLAMVVDLLHRSHTGAVHLTRDDRTALTAMLHASDDHAATHLWTKYGGHDHTLWNKAFPTYGMTSLAPQKGYSPTYPYWGYQKCTTADLDRLMTHVLDTLPPPDRAFILNEMRTVAPNQQWGVWGAGPAATPGNKDGWSEEDGGWVMNTVGFAGPAERYTLAIMNNLNNKGAYDEGRTTDTEIARLLFEGRF